MIRKEHIEEIVEEHLLGTKKFLVKTSVGKDNLVSVYIDSEEGVTIDDCARLSRFVEKQLDRDSEDFELRVSSPGADEPFVDFRQYKKNIGRPVRIKLKNGDGFRGLLEYADNKEVRIKEEKKSKNKKQKKINTGESVRIPLEEISETKVIITF